MIRFRAHQRAEARAADSADAAAVRAAAVRAAAVRAEADENVLKKKRAELFRDAMGMSMGTVKTLDESLCLRMGRIFFASRVELFYFVCTQKN